MKFSRTAGNRAWLILLLASFLPEILLPQTQKYQFEHLTIEDGLSQNSVRCILQDYQGFMWFGTDDGLNTFDGYRFTHYKNRHGDATSISNNTINVIYEDQSGTLWIGTNGGLNRFDRRTETFRHFRYDPNNLQTLNDNIVSAIYEDAAGTLWVGTQWGLHKMDRSIPGKEKMKRYQHRFDEYDRPWMQWVQGIGEYVGEQDSVLFVGSWGAGLLRFDRKTETYSRCSFPDVERDLQFRRWISEIHVDHTGDVWVADAEIHKYDPQTRVFRTIFKSKTDDNKAHAHRVFNSSSGHLLIGTGEQGLVLFDHELQQFIHLQRDPNDPVSLGNDWIEAIYEDKAGEIWIGTERGGISKYDPVRKRFATYRFQSQDRSTVSEDNIVATISTHSGAVLAVSRIGGLHVLDRQNKIFVPHQHNFRNAPHLRQILSRSVYQDSAGRIWFGSWGLGLYVYKDDTPAAKVLYHYIESPGDPASLISNDIAAICESREGEMWIGTPLGISILRMDELENGKFRQYRHDPSDSTSLGDMRADVILQDNTGQIWIGAGGGGLSLYNRQTDSFTRYKHNPYDANSLSSDVVLSIFQDSKDRLWVGTRGGLDRFVGETGSFIHYTEADGLPNAVINGIVEDGRSNLWVSTNNGLSKFDPDLKIFKNYAETDGLLSRESHPGAIAKNAVTDEIIVGGPLGLTIFHPDSIRDNPYVPPVVITQFEQLNPDISVDRLIEMKGVSQQKNIQLSHNARLFTVKFAALSYENPAKNRYAYKIEGIHDQWINLGTKREVTFTGLGPGEYVLRVKGSNNDGIWNEQGASLRITILPPWWQTWWAYALYGIAVLGFLYGLRRYEMNRQRWKHSLELERVESEKLKELDSLKSRFFANISHEFRTPLTLILGPLENLRAGRFNGDPDKQYGVMERNARRLLRLINQLLDLSKLDAGKLTLQASYGNLIPFVKGMVYSFESLAERKKIALHFEAKTDEIMLWFDRDKVEKIVSNLLSNAFRFTPDGGRVSVAVAGAGGSATATAAAAEITIRDSGPGIAADRLPHVFDRFYTWADGLVKNHEGVGIGLALTKELVELHRGEICVASAVGKGTAFTIRLPLGRAHLDENEIAVSEQLSVTSDLCTVIRGQCSVASNEHPATSDQSILIVEDNPDMRAYIQEQLRETYHICEAEDGEHGFAAATEMMPDLIISDVMMPKMDGYQLCEKLKIDERTSHIPVILLTAKSSGESKLEGLELGADDYLIKPFDSRELTVRIKNLIEQRRKLRKRFGKEIKLQPKDIAITSVDEKFLERAMAVVEEYIAEADFDVETFGRKVGMSRKHMHRKLKALTDQAPSEFIRTLRLQRAAQLLDMQAGNVTEIAYAVGFNSLSHFAKAFKEQFGVLPKDFIRQQSQRV